MNRTKIVEQKVMLHEGDVLRVQVKKNKVQYLVHRSNKWIPAPIKEGDMLVVGDGTWSQDFLHDHPRLFGNRVLMEVTKELNLRYSTYDQADTVSADEIEFHRIVLQVFRCK